MFLPETQYKQLKTLQEKLEDQFISKIDAARELKYIIEDIDNKQNKEEACA